MSYARLGTRLYNTPLLITPDKAEALEHVFRMHAEGRAAELPPFEPPERVDLAAQMSMRRADGGYYVTTSGIAVVRVHGSLVQRGSNIDAMSGLTGYGGLTSQLSAAARSSEVRGIVLEIDSPGGEVAGLAEFAEFVASVDKPVWAHANELAASAAYWVASATDKIHAPKTAILGSIGVVMLHVDRSVALAKAGVTYTPIFAGARKVDGASFAPLSDEARANAQARVDEIYSLFVKQVAGRRGMSEKAVRETEAGVFSAGDAMKRKLLDNVATLAETVQSMTDEMNAGHSIRKPNYGRAAVTPAQSQQEKLTMDEEAKKAAALVAEKAAKDQADAKATADAKTEGTKAGVEAERTRIKGITQHAEAAGRTKLAEHLAYNSAMTVEEAAAMLAAAPKEAATAVDPLAAAMAGTNPKVGADKENNGAAVVAVNTAAIYSARATQRLVAINGGKS